MVNNNFQENSNLSQLVMKELQQQTLLLHEIAGLLRKSEYSLLPSNENFFTVKEAARILKRSEATVRRWIECGKLAAVKNGDQQQDHYSISKASIDAMLKPKEAVTFLMKNQNLPNSFKLPQKKISDTKK